MRIPIVGASLLLVACNPPAADCLEASARLCGPADLPCGVLVDELAADDTDYETLNLPTPSIALDGACRPHIGYGDRSGDRKPHVVGRDDAGAWIDATLPVVGEVGLVRVDGELAAAVLAGNPRSVIYPLRRIDEVWSVGDPIQNRAFHPGGLVGDDAGDLHIGAISGDGPYYLDDLVHDGEGWSSQTLTTDVPWKISAAVAPDGTISYAANHGRSVVWYPADGPPELVFESADVMALAHDSSRRLSLAVGGEANEPSILFLGARPLPDASEPPVAVMLATRDGGAWRVDDVEVDGVGNDGTRPLALVASAAGEVRGFYFRDGLGAHDRALVMFWPTADGLEKVDLLPDTAVRSASAQLGAGGEIHLALDAFDVRYLRIGPAASP